MRKILLSLLLTTLAANVSASSIGFDSSTYAGSSTISVDINYDFVSPAMFGGGFDVLFDTSILEFVSYTQVPLSGAMGTPQAAASPIGELGLQPGQYINAGVGSFDFFSGINTAGTIGTFVFNIISGGMPEGIECESSFVSLCLVPNNNPMVTLAGTPGDEVFANGITSANVSAVPLPAAAWFFITALIGLFGWKRKAPQCA